jgi:putative ABC transport system permease protein
VLRFLIDVYEGVRISLRALRMNKLRAALTTLAILIGVTTVVLMVTIILGLNKSVADQFAFLGSNTLYVSRWDWAGDNWRQMIKRPRVEVATADFLRRESQFAEAVSPFAQASRTVSFRSNRLTQVQVMGVDQDYSETNSVKIDLGRWFNEDDVKRNRQVVTIGSGISEKLFDRTGPLDQRLDIGGQKFRVIGVHTKQGRFFGQDMDNFVYVPIGAFTKAFWHDADVNVVAKAKNQDQVEDMRWELRGLMRRYRRLAPTEADNFGINGQDIFMNIYRQITSSIYAGGFMIAAISLIVGGIGIMNIMLVSVTERTSEIGLRKALGARRWVIMWQFLLEAAVLCALGGVLGVALAYAGSQIMNKFLPTYMPLWVVAFGVAFAALVGVFFGFYPSLKAARLSPIEALRQE